MTTREESEARVARYNAERCPCGGSPAWVPEHQQVHAVEWHDRHGWFDEDEIEAKAEGEADPSPVAQRIVVDAITRGTPVHCEACGVKALRINNHTVINPGPGEMPAVCLVKPPTRPGGPLLPHGPWIRD